ncbi:MAG: NAD(P)(+) transhydrogenase (Re/Si-specific) subunit beta [Planctomycetes bacterium]|nr:NAD(P)(+) transhydrogenase (Re/Si-specific) subunit beta [Planctomycetota bacterium]MCP4772033.1 NAD(P)(+) transhydrogenase (Re/Si-specific) subunit beta [Planctomycetota bacterium]
MLYLVATFLFILGIKRLSKVRTARSGNQLAAVGMLLAIVVTLVSPEGGIELGWTTVVAGLLLGGLVGGVMAKRVEMTGMPELVALFNGFGGLASTFVAVTEFWGRFGSTTSGSPTETVNAVNDAAVAAGLPEVVVLGGGVWAIAIVLSVLIGTVTFTGSLVAMGKLSGKISGNPVILPGRHLLTAVLLIGGIAAGVYGTFYGEGSTAVLMVGLLALGAGLFGIVSVLPIGGADMPVVVSLLNSYSGLAASMAGFVIGNSLLIVAGALVGAAGLILTMVMCKAMNRSLGNVLIGGFGGDAPAAGGGGADEYTGVKSAGPEEAAMILEAATSVIFIPGYGMAVAQAQHIVKELGEEMEKRGAEVRYAIHPVAGRMPGHMNVLLAESDVPYEQLWELERINGDFKTTDVTVIIGANDVVNPEAIENPQSPIAGMPILNAHESGTVLMIKRSLSPGYAGIKNPLFERDNTYMCFGDGKAFVVDVVNELKES